MDQPFRTTTIVLGVLLGVAVMALALVTVALVLVVMYKGDRIA